MITTFLLHLLLILTALPILVAPLAIYTMRELAPASQRPGRPAFAGGGGWR